jgi:hypothetical protein
MHPGQDLDQRRLAGAIVSDERYDLARVHIQINVSQGGYGAKVLRDATQAEHEFARVALFLVGVRHWAYRGGVPSKIDRSGRLPAAGSSFMG